MPRQARRSRPPLTNDPVPANKDFAGGDDDQVASASEVDVVNSLSKRRRELDARERQLTTQANMIAAAEARVDAKIAQLKQLQAQINGLLAQRDDAQKAQIDSLVKTYSTMKAKDAARIFNGLPDEVLVPVAQEMKVRHPGAGPGQHEFRQCQVADGEAGRPAGPAADHGQARPIPAATPAPATPAAAGRCQP